VGDLHEPFVLGERAGVPEGQGLGLLELILGLEELGQAAVVAGQQLGLGGVDALDGVLATVLAGVGPERERELVAQRVTTRFGDDQRAGLRVEEHLGVVEDGEAGPTVLRRFVDRSDRLEPRGVLDAHALDLRDRDLGVFDRR
jgi:hypothetical protein